MSIKKRAAALFAAVSVVAIAGVAVAYFTSQGSGTGSGKVAAVEALALDNIAIVGELYPGSSNKVTFTLTNPSKAPIYVDGVQATSIVTAENCASSAFSFARVAVGERIPAGESRQLEGVLAMADQGNQNACQGKPVDLVLSVDNAGY